VYVSVFVKSACIVLKSIMLCGSDGLSSIILTDCIPLRIEGRRQSLMVILSLDKENFQKLPQKLQAGSTIKVHPVLVTHGIKIRQ
jgi:hypothetical protein